jgi:hypothetical protein
MYNPKILGYTLLQLKKAENKKNHRKLEKICPTGSPCLKGPPFFPVNPDRVKRIEGIESALSFENWCKIFFRSYPG